jgi:hypothetical protein
MALHKPRALSPEDVRERLLEYRLEVIPVRQTPPEFRASFEAAYLAWLKMWTPVFTPLGHPPLASDDFTRQDEIGAIFRDSTCLAFTLYRTVDTESRAVRDDSYFRIWPELAVAALARDSPRILICSYLAVERAARRRSAGVSLTEVMIAMNSRYLLESQASASAGMTRNDRGINTVCRAQGARLLASGLKFHGFDVDLVAFYKNELSASVTPYAEVLDEFWANRRRPVPPLCNAARPLSQ